MDKQSNKSKISDADFERPICNEEAEKKISLSKDQSDEKPSRLMDLTDLFCSFPYKYQHPNQCLNNLFSMKALNLLI
jgi:hypothetical protein